MGSLLKAGETEPHGATFTPEQVQAYLKRERFIAEIAKPHEIPGIASVLSGHPACHEVGMTGEITLRGRVLPVGGVKMKVLAAHRAGLSSVIIPKQNERDLDELPEDVREALTFIPVDLIGEALQAALRTNVATQAL